MTLLSVLLVYGYIQLPFLLWASYPILKRAKWIASPYLFLPGVALFGIWLFTGQFYLTHYSHFLIAPLMIGVSYVALWKGLKFEKVDAAVLSMMGLLASDSLWQVPIFLNDWTYNLAAFEVGMTSAGWSMMSIPLFFLFLKPRRLDVPSRVLLTVGSILTVADLPMEFSPYLLIVPWLLFMLFAARSNRPVFPLKQ